MTKLESDFTLIFDKQAPSHAAYSEFKQQMEGRQYGEEAINDAWWWFKSGWECRDKSNPVAEQDPLRKKALALYSPPFRYDQGYFWDSETEMVADEHIARPEDPAATFLRMNAIARIRGWGRIGYLPDPEKLQDAVGNLIAEALTEYWQRRLRNEG